MYVILTFYLKNGCLCHHNLCEKKLKYWHYYTCKLSDNVWNKIMIITNVMLYLPGVGRYIPNPEFNGQYTWNFALTTIGCSRLWCYHLLQRRVKVFGICLLLFHIFTCLLYTYNGFKFWALGTMFCNQYLVLCTCMGICESFMLTMYCQLYF